MENLSSHRRTFTDGHSNSNYRHNGYQKTIGSTSNNHNNYSYKTNKGFSSVQKSQSFQMDFKNDALRNGSPTEKFRSRRAFEETSSSSKSLFFYPKSVKQVPYHKMDELCSNQSFNRYGSINSRGRTRSYDDSNYSYSSSEHSSNYKDIKYSRNFSNFISSSKIQSKRKSYYPSPKNQYFYSNKSSSNFQKQKYQFSDNDICVSVSSFFPLMTFSKKRHFGKSGLRHFLSSDSISSSDTENLTSKATCNLSNNDKTKVTHDKTPHDENAKNDHKNSYNQIKQEKLESKIPLESDNSKSQESNYNLLKNSTSSTEKVNINKYLSNFDENKKLNSSNSEIKDECSNTVIDKSVSKHIKTDIIDKNRSRSNSDYLIKSMNVICIQNDQIKTEPLYLDDAVPLNKHDNPIQTDLEYISNNIDNHMDSFRISHLNIDIHKLDFAPRFFLPSVDSMKNYSYFNNEEFLSFLKKRREISKKWKASILNLIDKEFEIICNSIKIDNTKYELDVIQSELYEWKKFGSLLDDPAVSMDTFSTMI